SAEYSFQAQRALKKTSVDWGKTSLMMMQGQYNSLNTDRNITITQTLAFPTVSATEVKVNQAQTAASEQSYLLSKASLAWQVKTTYNQLQYLLALQQLLQSQDTLLGNLARAAALRYKAGEVGLLEKTSAETQWMETQNQVQQNANLIAIEQSKLKTLLQSSGNPMPATTLAKAPGESFSTELDAVSNPHINYWKYQAQGAHATRQVERNKFLPDITVGYFSQSLIGFQRTGGSEVFYDKSKKFTGWMLGAAIPLWFLPQTGRAQSAALHEKAAQRNYEAAQRQTEGAWNQALAELKRQQNNLNYYEGSALSNAELILTQAQKAYRAGEISYLEFLQGMKNAQTIRSGYLLALSQYNATFFQIEYLNGKF
ncbi:MAG: TolC family protein, partial [Bacteroidota bacterium]